jgi:hypothetical protein
MAERYLIEIYLPLFGETGKPFPRRLYASVRTELVKRFGGMTAYSRSPAIGLWKEPSARTKRDEIVIYEVITAPLDKKWWAAYRRSLEDIFQQKELIVRAQRITLL